MQQTSRVRAYFVNAALLIASASHAIGGAPPPTVTAGPAIPVGGEPGVAQGEGLFVTHPDGRRVLACIMEVAPIPGQRVAVRVSDAPAEAWKQTFVSAWEQNAADPACAYGGDGTAYLVVAPRSREPDRASYTMRVYRSPDGGHTWSSAAELPMLDRHSVVVDQTQGRFGGRIYVHGVGTNYTFDGARRGNLTLLHSVDGGATFRAPVARASSGRSEPFEIGNSVVLPDGTWLTVFGELRQGWQQAESNDGGFRFMEPDDVFANADLRVLRSSDGGEHLDITGTVSDWHMPVRERHFVAALPALAVDTSSGPFAGRVYVVWGDKRRGYTDLFFSYSTDSGRRWSTPTVVNDAWRTAREHRDHFMPMVAVSRTGVVGVAWYDRRDHADNRGWNLRFAASVDGGESFLPSIAIAGIQARFDGAATEPIISRVTNAAGDQPASGRVGFSRFFYIGGDYAGMAVRGDGAFLPYGLGNSRGLHATMTVPLTVAAPSSRFGYPELDRLTDLTRSVEVDAGASMLDPRTNEVSIVVTLRNGGQTAVPYPAWLRLTRIRSDFGDVVASNSDASAGPDSAVWRFDGSGTSTLGPGQRSPKRVLTFRFAAAPARNPDARARLALVSFEARVLGSWSNTEPNLR